ncbi:hypothetical protein SLS53_002530 [Cytospora paraplurivora]|uniref:BTB domain-containing protein n=1 Tax=Cytospora paraplurivora TaxID=2898453 RepID=A0AAN9UDR4_9PEZI
MSTQLGRDNLKLFESGFLSDAQVICKERTWNVHKLILCGRSTWFKKALTGGWSETASSKVTVNEMDPDTMDAVLRFIYSGDLTIKVKDKHLCIASYVHLWSHADFFKLDDMKAKVILRILNSFVDIALRGPSKRFWIGSGQGKNLDCFNTDLFQAIGLAYKNSQARELQKTLTACAFAMGTDLSKDHLLASEQLPQGFKADLLAVLIHLRFDAKFSLLHATHNPLGTCEKCHLALTGECFKMGISRWCHNCGKDVLLSTLQDIVALM